MATSKRLSDEKIEHNIAQVNASLAMEGMPLTDEDKKVLRQFAKGELSMDDIIQSFIKRDKQ